MAPTPGPIITLALALAWALAPILPGSVSAGCRLRAQEFQVDMSRPNQVAFVAHASLNEFRGVTDRVDGYAYLSGEGLGGNTDLGESELHFEVDLASLDTGIGLRNRHMRERYLETSKYPFATFDGKIAGLEPTEEGRYRVTTRGTLAIHGERRETEVECEATPADGDERVVCAFPVTLPDFGIGIPRFMFLEVDETVQLQMDLYLKPVANGGRDAE